MKLSAECSFDVRQHDQREDQPQVLLEDEPHVDLRGRRGVVRGKKRVRREKTYGQCE